MALETWLIKVKKTLSHSFDSVRAANTSSGAAPPPPPHSKPVIIKKSNVGVLSFEISSLMSKLLHIWQSLSDKNIARLRSESISLEGVRKIVSNNDAFLLSLACAEMVENLRLVSKSVSRLSKKSADAKLRSFERLLNEFADSGRDPNKWVLQAKEMELKNKKMHNHVTTTAALHKEMDELSILENTLRKSLVNECSIKEQKIVELQQKIQWQKQEVKYLKDRSLWSRSFDTVTSLLAKSIFTIIAKIKLVFNISHCYPPSLPRSLSASAMVYPSENPNTSQFVSGPLMSTKNSAQGFFNSNSKTLKPPSSTLGAAALSLHYANVIIVMEKMIRSPHLIGIDARNDLYSMLPYNIRACLRSRLKGIGFSAADSNLAAEWKDALQKILGWLSPLAHNMIKWQSERSFEHQKIMPKTNVLLFQTLYFANQEKIEAAITELLVGLNYIWRFEREMNSKALFESINFNMLMNLQNSS